MSTPNYPLFETAEITIDGSYNGNTNGPVVHISFLDVFGHGMQENVVS